jgi:DNA-binding NarL/FixJ family response regulator
MMRILLADDHTLLLQGLTLTIKELFPQSELYCNGSWQEVEQTLQSNSFDLALFDIFMPSAHTWEQELANIVKKYPTLSICMVSSSSEQIHIESAFKLGAKGYLCKTASLEEMKQALLTVAQGKQYIPSQTWHSSNSNDTLGLTERQQELLKFMAQGKTAKQIAQELQISENTVKSHFAMIYQILNVNNRVEAVNMARQKGMLGHYS